MTSPGVTTNPRISLLVSKRTWIEDPGELLTNPISIFVSCGAIVVECRLVAFTEFPERRVG